MGSVFRAHFNGLRGLKSKRIKQTPGKNGIKTPIKMEFEWGFILLDIRPTLSPVHSSHFSKWDFYIMNNLSVTYGKIYWPCIYLSSDKIVSYTTDLHSLPAADP